MLPLIAPRLAVRWTNTWNSVSPVLCLYLRHLVTSNESFEFGNLLVWNPHSRLCFKCQHIMCYPCLTCFLIGSFRFIVLRRIFLLVGIHYYYRAITMYVTVLPKPNMSYTCAPKANETTALVIFQRVLKLLSGMGLSINGKHVYCGDYIYSGHTMTLIMTYLVIKECESIFECLRLCAQ